jgi:hypothetical protein
MRNEVMRDMTDAARAFQELAWPAIAPHLDGGDYMSLENTKGIAEFLDQTAGFDGLQIVNGMARGLAIRMQPSERSWDTFTIRFLRQSGATTEFEKRNAAVTAKYGGWLSPVYTIHGYYEPTDFRLLAVAAVRSNDLYPYIARDIAAASEGDKRTYFQENGSDKNAFIVVPWRNLIQDGVPVIVAPISLRTALEVPLKRRGLTPSRGKQLIGGAT